MKKRVKWAKQKLLTMFQVRVQFFFCFDKISELRDRAYVGLLIDWLMKKNSFRPSSLIFNI